MRFRFLDGVLVLSVDCSNCDPAKTLFVEGWREVGGGATFLEKAKSGELGGRRGGFEIAKDALSGEQALLARGGGSWVKKDERFLRD